MENLKKINFPKILILASIVIILSYQNCAKNNFNSKSSMEEEYYKSYSKEDEQALKNANLEIKSANINVYVFLDILESFDGLTKSFANDLEALNLIGPTVASPSANVSEQTIASEKIKNIQVVSNVISKLFGALNTIPTLEAGPRADLENALANLRLMKKPHTDDLVLKSLLILIKLKGFLLDELSVSKQDITTTQEQKITKLKAILNSIDTLLDELSSDMLVARPSGKESIANFKKNFHSIVQLLIATNWQPQNPTETSAQTEAEINAARNEFLELLHQITTQVQVLPVPPIPSVPQVPSRPQH